MFIDDARYNQLFRLWLIPCSQGCSNKKEQKYPRKAGLRISRHIQVTDRRNDTDISTLG